MAGALYSQSCNAIDRLHQISHETGCLQIFEIELRTSRRSYGCVLRATVRSPNQTIFKCLFKITSEDQLISAEQSLTAFLRSYAAEAHM